MLKRLALFVALVLISGCSGFEAKVAPNQILTLRNVAPPVAISSVRPEPQARPLPILSGKRFGVPSEQKVNPSLVADPTIADTTQKPYSAGGRFEFTTDGVGYYCTAELIDDTGVVLTAAHCLWDDEKHVWSQNIRFLHRYDNGISVPYDWECGAIFSHWTIPDYRFDYAFVRLRGSPPPGLGLAAENIATVHDSIGYPFNYFGGYQMVHVKAATSPASFGLLRRHAPNAMLGGSSGGAWVNSRMLATSLNSHGYDNQPNVMYGPVFDTSTIQLYEYVREGCPSGDAVALGRRVESGARFYTARFAPKGGEFTLIRPASIAVPVQALIYGVWHEQPASGRLHAVSLAANQYRASFLCGTACDGLRLRVLHVIRSDLLGSTWQPQVASNALEQLLAGVADRCTAICSDPSNRICLRTGYETLPIMRQLQSMSTALNRLSTGGNGSRLSTADWLREIKATPAQNICHRGDFERANNVVTNSGLECTMRAKSGTSSFKFATVMDAPSTVAGDLRSATNNFTLYPDAAFAPRLSFDGEDAQPYQERFGGDVISSREEVIGGERRLVVTTSSGCISGPLEEARRVSGRKS